MKLRRNRFAPTGRIKNIHVEIDIFPRGYRYKAPNKGAKPH